MSGVDALVLTGVGEYYFDVYLTVVMTRNLTALEDKKRWLAFQLSI